MKIDEIVPAMEPPTDELTQYLISFMRGKSTDEEILNNGLILRKNEDDDHIYLGLFKPDDPHETRLKAYLKVVKNSPYPRIGFIAVAKDYRRRGWMRKLIDWFVQNIGPLTSDNAQTDAAKEMWLALIKMPGDLDLYKYSLRTGRKSKLKIIMRNDKPYPNPWDGSRNHVILAEEYYEPDPIFREQLERHRRLGRPLIWYDIEADGDNINP